MKTIRYRYEEIPRLFPELQPLHSPQRLIQAELALAGYWAAQQNGKSYLVMSYLLPTDPSFAFGVVRPPAPSDLIDVEEYDNPQEWAERIERLTGAPGASGDGSNLGSGVPVRPTPPAPEAGAAQEWPVGTTKDPI